MSAVYIPEATRGHVVAELTRSWVDTTTAAHHVCLRRCTSGDVLWTLWECTDSYGLKLKYIGCDQLLHGALGWGYKAMIEGDDLPFVSCPLAYLREALVVSPDWRAQVVAYWSAPRTRTGMRQRLANRASAQRFKEGDRVRLAGVVPRLRVPQGSRGTVTRAQGPFGPSIHGDELCNTTFVRWDQGGICAAFTLHLAPEWSDSGYSERDHVGPDQRS